MAKRGEITFFEFMQHYPHTDPDRLALAANMQQLAPKHKDLEEIDSLVDLMIASKILTDNKAKRAVTGALWCEYCTISGHPMIE